MKKKAMYCFSPAVMIGTFSLELALAAYVFFRYGAKYVFNRLTILLLVLLAAFQIAEFMICSGLQSSVWGRIGFMATALMPPVGLHIVSLITGKRGSIPLAYSLGLLFMVLFGLLPGAVTNGVCGGNYVMFSTTQPMFHFAYGLYYGIFLLWGLISALFVRDNITQTARSVLRWIAAGYTSFMLPTVLIYFAYPGSRGGFASILCGFAVVMALILALAVLPRFEKFEREKVMATTN